MDDGQALAKQLGRVPRGAWRVAERCSFGFPLVLATAPRTESGEPFPTLYYLTCPHLVGIISTLESEGALERWRQRLAVDPALMQRLQDADARYREARTAEGGGIDPTPGVGIGGERDVRGVKCLHAHVAAALAGLGDPIGEETLDAIELECTDARCKEE
jgi:hypothetical protein